VADDPVDMLVGQPGQTGMCGAQITPGVPVGPAERHGQKCRLLRHLAIHVDIVEIRRQKRIGQNLTIEKLGGGSDRRSAA
jgi:hypothetical protein